MLHFIVVVYVCGGLYDLGEDTDQDWLPWVGLGGLLLLLGVLISARKLTRWPRPTWPRQFMRLSAIGMGVPLVASVAVAVIVTAVSGERLLHIPALATLLVTVLASSAVGVFCALTRR